MAGLAAPMGFGGSWAGFVGPGGGPWQVSASPCTPGGKPWSSELFGWRGAWAFSGEEFMEARGVAGDDDVGVGGVVVTPQFGQDRG